MRCRGTAAKPSLLAGGHSLIPMLNLRLIAPGRLIDVEPAHGAAVHRRRVRTAAHRRADDAQHDPAFACRRGELPDHDRGLPRTSPIIRSATAARSAATFATTTPPSRCRSSSPCSAATMIARSARWHAHHCRRKVFQGAVRDRSRRRRDAGRGARSADAGRPWLLLPRGEPALRRSRADRRRLPADHPLRRLPGRAHRLSQRGRQRAPGRRRGSRDRGQAGFGRR